MQEMGVKSEKDRLEFLSYFDRHDNMAVMDGKMLDWYVENILGNKKKYKIEEAERVVSKGGGEEVSGLIA